MGERSDRYRRHLVIFDQPHRAVRAAEVLRRRSYAVVEAHTPFAVHGMDTALGMRESRLPWATLVGGLVGGAVGLGFPLWVHATDWPLNIGGKDYLAWPAIAPVTFEVIVLLAAFATVGGLLWASRLRPRRDIPTTQPSPVYMRDNFVLVVEERDGTFDLNQFREESSRLGATALVENWRVQ